MKQTECFAGDFMDNGLPGFVFKTMVVLRFCEKMRNYCFLSLAWTISFEFCWDKSWKTNETFYFNQIETGKEIFTDKKCQVTFGFE